MVRCALSSAVLLVLVASCNQENPNSTPTPQPSAFSATVNPDVVPEQTTILDVEGNTQPVCASRDENGVQSDFIEGVVLIKPKDDADLQAFLTRYGGTVIDDDTIPEPPAELGITLTEAERAPTEFVVRINLDQVDLTNLAANASAVGLQSALEFTSQAGLQTFAAKLDARASGFSAGSDYVYQSTQALPVGAFGAYFTTQELPTGGGTFTDAFNEPRFGNMGSFSNVTLAWQFLFAHGIQRRTSVAIIDNGFWLDTAGRARGPNSDFVPPPTRPVQYDITAEDSIADGPNTIGCGVGNPCYWHGTGCASVAAGIVDNRLAYAGTGGLVADPWLLRFNGSLSQRNEAVRTASCWLADVVSMSFGKDCNEGCRVDDRDETPFSDAVNAGRKTVFLAAAGNGRGMPAAGYDVGSPNFYHPCHLEHVVCVGALADNTTTKIGYSNFGSRVNIFAPTNIPAMSYPNSFDALGNALPIAQASGAEMLQPSFGGTSASTPFVAGIVAMMKSLNPSLGTDEVTQILTETARPGTAPANLCIDALACVRRAAEGIDNIPDRFEPNNGSGAPTDLGNDPPYNAPNLSLDAQDHDFFEFESPSASEMAINLQYPVGLGTISVITLQSSGDTCGSPTLVSDVPGTNGRIISYEVPAGHLVLGLRADDVNAYHITISFAPPVFGTDSYESNNTVAAADFIHSYGAGFNDALVIDPRVTIQATLHNDSPADIDYYIVRGARLSNAETALLFGAPFVSVYANTAPINMHVYLLNADGTQGAAVGQVSGQSCAGDLVVLLQPDVYYLVKIDGDVGQYTLFNGAYADVKVLPPILVGDIPPEIIQPGPVEIDREAQFDLLFLFVADPAFDAVFSLFPGVHLSLFDLDGTLIAEGAANELGERLSLSTTVANQGYVLQVTPTDFTEGNPMLGLQWEAASAERDSENLIENPGAETTSDEGDVPSWEIVQSTPVILSYGSSPEYPSDSDPGPTDRGERFFAGGTDNNMSALRQTVVIDPDWQEAIDAGRVKFRFAAFLGGNLDEADAASARLIFRRADDSVTGQASLPEITAIDRAGETGLLPIEVSDYLPAGTAVILVDISFRGGVGNFNDAYADNLELILSEFAQ